jgi:hypothetical protein
VVCGHTLSPLLATTHCKEHTGKFTLFFLFFVFCFLSPNICSPRPISAFSLELEHHITSPSPFTMSASRHGKITRLTKVIATLGPASQGRLDEMILAGVVCSITVIHIYIQQYSRPNSHIPPIIAYLRLN